MALAPPSGSDFGFKEIDSSADVRLRISPDLAFDGEVTPVTYFGNGCQIAIPIHISLSERQFIEQLADIEAFYAAFGKGSVDLTGSRACTGRRPGVCGRCTFSGCRQLALVVVENHDQVRRVD